MTEDEDDLFSDVIESLTNRATKAEAEVKTLKQMMFLSGKAATEASIRAEQYWEQRTDLKNRIIDLQRTYDRTEKERVQYWERLDRVYRKLARDWDEYLTFWEGSADEIEGPPMESLMKAKETNE